MDLPYTLIAELTHRCPLSCAYCSNPVRTAAPPELEPGVWLRVLGEAHELGVVQVHFTGGEPLLYRDLGGLVVRAAELGLSSQLVTSAVGLTRNRLHDLHAAGLSSLQISLHDRAGHAWPPEHAVRAARSAKELGLPVTLNLVLHRGNLERVTAAIALAEELAADRLELANVQYLGWAFTNRAGLLPSAEQIAQARVVAGMARERLRGTLDLVFVLPDHHAGRPRACMHGWGRRFLVIAPDGAALPCHAAQVLGLSFDKVTERSLDEIWLYSSAFAAFRGDAWMAEPCRSCARKDADFGGCRCQALLLTGDARAADPACHLSPHHDRVQAAVAASGTLVPLRARRHQTPTARSTSALSEVSAQTPGVSSGRTPQPS
jgi:pyrroloquinoline quinone biosynthesis protein E